MEKFLELLKIDGEKAQEFITNSLAKAFIEIGDGSIESEFQQDFEKIEIFMIVKKRGEHEK